MLLADLLFLVIVVYLAYRFVFNFLLPIVRATHQVRKQFRNMQGQSNDFSRSNDFGGQGNGGTRPGAGGARPGSGGTQPGAGGGKGSYKPPAEDYIDFEEVK
ncbi:MAG TPA: hypothetical protein VFE32_09955 [Puia sp.]|jgi:uncharacterized membrane protein YgcG|nr:hypothetical protein [Puia sp.]